MALGKSVLRTVDWETMGGVDVDVTDLTVLWEVIEAGSVPVVLAVVVVLVGDWPGKNCSVTGRPRALQASTSTINRSDFGLDAPLGCL